jgi:5-hydroxyisourate hydrolase
VSTLSTHVLDAALGQPAAGVHVTLEHRAGDGRWQRLGNGVTDADGRVPDLAAGRLQPGTHRLTFATGEYFAATDQAGFYPEVSVTFTVTDERHYHVPLLLSPFAFSTYRGS